MMDKVDLHVHSACSDGTYTPTELVNYALQKGLRAFALTDHDTTDGLKEAFLAAKETDLEVVAGIEFSTEYRGTDVHVVGLDITYTSPAFTEPLRRFRASRDLRNEKIVARMQSAGFSISMEMLKQKYGDAVITRAHFARFLMECGKAKDLPDAFSRYLGEGCPFYVPREKVTPQQAVSLIAKTGGIPVLAHPMIYHFSETELNELLSSLKKEGLIGIEAIYSTHSASDERYVRQVAKRHGLLISGGSDFHGANKPSIDLGSGHGNLCISYDILENLRSRKCAVLDGESK